MVEEEGKVEENQEQVETSGVSPEVKEEPTDAAEGTENSAAEATNEGDGKASDESDKQSEQVEVEEEQDINQYGPDLDLMEEDLDPLLDPSNLKPILERRDRSIKELLEAMNEYSPIIPDAVTDYYLSKAGFKTSDVRIKRLLALATQKFISDIATDAYQYARVRNQSGVSSGGVVQGAGIGGGGAGGFGGLTGGIGTRGRPAGSYGSNRTVLTMETLSTVLAEYGIHAKRPEFYR